MKQNVASWDRIVRAVAGLTLFTSAFFAPLPLLVRVLALGLGGLYMVATAGAGTCLGYRLMGLSTCPVEQRKTAL
jgi:biotin transporter BioY